MSSAITPVGLVCVELQATVYIIIGNTFCESAYWSVMSTLAMLSESVFIKAYLLDEFDRNALNSWSNTILQILRLMRQHNFPYYDYFLRV